MKILVVYYVLTCCIQNITSATDENNAAKVKGGLLCTIYKLKNWIVRIPRICWVSNKSGNEDKASMNRYNNILEHLYVLLKYNHEPNVNRLPTHIGNLNF